MASDMEGVKYEEVSLTFSSVLGFDLFFFYKYIYIYIYNCLCVCPNSISLIIYGGVHRKFSRNEASHMQMAPQKHTQSLNLHLSWICHGMQHHHEQYCNQACQSRLALYGIDYEGHGKSTGLKGYVKCFDDVVDDCTNHFTNICESKENEGKMRYLLGESMGAAVALLVHRKKPEFWDGAVLVGPMCKIADELRPSPFVISALTKLCKFIPTWKIIPTNDIIDVAFKVPEIREQIRENPYCYKGRPRLQTGYELLRGARILSRGLKRSPCRS